MVIFGAGDLFLKEASGATPKSIKAATLKGASADISEELVKLRGAKKFPKDVANGEASLTGTISLGEIQPAIVAASMPGATTAAGYEELVTDALAAIPTTPFTITVAGSADFNEDYGVEFADGTPLTRVASAPTAGQYSVNETTGVYTFASADNVSGKSVAISYVKDVASTGQTTSYTNQLMGSGSTWKLRLWNTYGGKKVGIYLPAIKLAGGGFNFQTGAHATPEYKFEAFEDANGLVFKFFSSVTA